MTESSDIKTCAMILKWCEAVVNRTDSCAERARLIDLAREALEAGRYDLCVKLATDAAGTAPQPAAREGTR